MQSPVIPANSEVAVRLALNLRKRRTSMELTLRDLAQLSGISKGNISKIESLEGNPTLATIDALAAALKLTPQRLLS